MRYATTELVAAAWLGTLTGLNPSMVGDKLPEDPTSWPNGFITTAGAGGSSVPDVLLISPVVMLKCWAATPDTEDPPWGMANNLAETVRQGCYDLPNITRLLTLPNCDQTARVNSAYLVSEPRRDYGDNGDYACVVVDLRLYWTAS